MHSEIVVIGGGAIGASIAVHLSQMGHEVLILEKEPQAAQHQSGRNSGVIHAGYNVSPGTLKARFCVEGNRRLRAYCRERGIPMYQGGILVVARAEAELPALAELLRRGDANGVLVRRVDATEIPKIEPHARGVQALHAPDGASFDSTQYVRSLIRDAEGNGARVMYRVRVLTIDDPSIGSDVKSAVQLRTSAGVIPAELVVNCAGLHADRLAADVTTDLRVVPFRGYYAELKPHRRHLVASHIYSVPDLSFPFLGVHLSRRVDGAVIVGPGAMLAFGREAYRFEQVQPRDLFETVTWPGFYRLLFRPGFAGLVIREALKSVSLRHIWNEARSLLPELEQADLVRSYAGNRAQLVSRDGSMVDDIVVRETPNAVHVLNAVSPGLTCSLPFGEDIARRCHNKLENRTLPRTGPPT